MKGRHGGRLARFPWRAGSAMNPAMARWLATLGLATTIAAALPAAGDEPRLGALGGATTMDAGGTDAFSHLAANAPAERRRDFALGSRLFMVEWVPFPDAVKLFDGLGPTFNQPRCSSCHDRNGRGAPPIGPADDLTSALVRLSVGAGGSAIPHPAYGDQLNDRAIPGVAAEGRVVRVE